MVWQKLLLMVPEARAHIYNRLRELRVDLPAAPVVYGCFNISSSRQSPGVVVTQPGQYHEDDADWWHTSGADLMAE